MPGVFALLVGIKDYHPQSGVGSLSGCINDVNHIEEWMQKKFAATDLHIRKLLNEAASRANFIGSFTDHLINNASIQPGDTVLFYYSGHGSYASSNPAFKAWDSEATDETLVLYDSRCNGQFDLADKELRLLLSAIRKDVQVVVILDSCHSGSATRDVDPADQILLGKPKHTPAANGASYRALEDYCTVNGVGYAKMASDGNGIIPVPPVKLIALSACSRNEVAYESSYSPDGMFTSQFLQALDAGPSDLSYAQVYEHVYTLLKRRARKQTPSLVTEGGFDADLIVLGNSTAKGNPVYNVVSSQGVVTINCGALHGLRNDPNSQKNTTVSIYDSEAPDTAALQASIIAVGLDYAELKAPPLAPKLYKAAVNNLPALVCIFVNLDEAGRLEWEKNVVEEKKPIPGLYFVYEADKYYDYSVERNGGNLELLERDSKKIVTSTTGKEPVKDMLSACEKVRNWHQVRSLTNFALADDALESRFKAKISLQVLNAATNEWETLPGDNHILYVPDAQTIIPARVIVETSATGKWFCSSVYLNSRYGVQKSPIPVDASLVSRDNPLSPFGDSGKFSLLEGMTETTEYFKIILAKDSFKDFLIDEFGGFERDQPHNKSGQKREFSTGSRIDQDWIAHTITIKIMQQSGSLVANAPLKKGKITIQPHQSLQGTASLSPLPESSKSVDNPMDAIRRLAAEAGWQLVSLSDTKSAEPLPVLWMDQLSGDVSAQQPLQISLAEPPADNTEVIAITMEDGILQMVGWGQANQDDNNYTFEIADLPPDGQRKKNLVRAAWFCFAKLVLQKDLSKLRRVVFTDGKMKYEDDFEHCVKPGIKTAVCVHGIIGDTKGMAQAMEFLLTDKKYDQLLAFDYENLTTNIEDIAGTFKELLEKAGVSKDAPIDIISHSMGGLISRYLIEDTPGTTGWVNQLFMFGTPNAGSVLGGIPKLRDWAVTIFTLAANVGGTLLGPAAKVLGIVGKGLGLTKPITHTLAEMAIGSAFYKSLNKDGKQTSTRYHIIAGNVLIFIPADDTGRVAKIMEKIKKGLGELLYSSTTPNDIAVGVDSILTLPAGITATTSKVACHHLNYFEVPDSMDSFKKLLG
jgi:pimeloyl-ACP methyl ester carboxylesterase